MATPPLRSPAPQPGADRSSTSILASRERFLPEILGAIDDEIAATPKPQPGPVTLKHGRSVRDRSGRATYSFKIPADVKHLPRDAHAEGTADGTLVKGTLRRVGGGRARFETNESLGALIQTLTVTLDTTFLFTALHRRISELGTAAVGTHPAVNRLLGQLVPDVHRVAQRHHTRTAGAATLNVEQREAVQAALGSGLLFIWGPAGTGKSLTLAELAMEYVAAGKSVLVVAPTHQAIDSVLAKILAHPEATPLVERGQLLRYGVIRNPALHESHGHQVEFAQVTAARKEALKQELENETDLLEMMQSSPHSFPDFEEERNRQAAHVVALSQELGTERAALLAGCRIMVATIHRTFLPDQIPRVFDAVIIDEASMVMLPHAITAAALATKHLVCAGDFRQLAPIALAQTPRAKCWLARDVFEISGVTAALEGKNGTLPPQLVMLTEQFRMDPLIASCVNAPIYGGRLRNNISVTQRAPAPIPMPVLTLIDTSLLGPSSERSKGSWANPEHARIVRAWIELHLARVPHDAQLTEESSIADGIAIIAPYVAQVATVRECLSESNNKTVGGIAVDTVHRFQGDERRTIVLDSTVALSPGQTLPRFLRAQVPGDDASRLLNVALTRARQHVVLIANMAYLGARFHEAPVLAALLNFFAQHAERVEVGFLLPDHAMVRGRRGSA